MIDPGALADLKAALEATAERLAEIGEQSAAAIDEASAQMVVAGDAAARAMMAPRILVYDDQGRVTGSRVEAAE